MFWTLIYPLSGACDYSVELPHWSYCSWFNVYWSFGVVGLEWYPCCRLKHCNTNTTPTQPHRNSNTHWTKNNTTNVVIQQNSRKLLIMDILMSETCWARKKWNEIASEIKLVSGNIYLRKILQSLVDTSCTLSRIIFIIPFFASYCQLSNSVNWKDGHVARTGDVRNPYKILRNCRLPPLCSWGLRSSGVFCGIGW